MDALRPRDAGASPAAYLRRSVGTIMSLRYAKGELAVKVN